MSLSCCHINFTELNFSSYGQTTVIEFKQQLQCLERIPLDTPPQVLVRSLWRDYVTMKNLRTSCNGYAMAIRFEQHLHLLFRRS